MRKTASLALVLCFCIIHGSPVVGAGSGYAEYTLRFDTAVVHDEVVLPSGEHHAVIVDPSLLSNTYKLVFLESRALTTSDVKKKAVLELPLTCSSNQIEAIGRQESSVMSKVEYSIIFLQFSEADEQIWQHTCVALIKNIAG